MREGDVQGSNSQNLLYTIFFGHENENVHEKHNFYVAPCTCIYSEVVGPGWLVEADRGVDVRELALDEQRVEPWQHNKNYITIT